MPIPSNMWPSKFDAYKYANIILAITQPAPQIPTIAPGMNNSTVIAVKPIIYSVIISDIFIKNLKYLPVRQFAGCVAIAKTSNLSFWIYFRI